MMSIRRLGNEISARTETELAGSETLRELLINTVPAMGPKWDIHLSTFLTSAALARLLWLDFLYRKAIEVPGCFVEFGSQWGASLNTVLLLKQIYEPWNAARRIVSFSTF